VVETLLPPSAEFSRSPQGDERGSNVFEFAAFDTTAGNSYTWSFFEINPDGALVSVGQSDDPNVRLILSSRNGGLFRACLVVTDTEGCESNFCENFEAGIEKYFFMPNAFTPDGDGINDLFFAVKAGYEDYTFVMSIFDRNGGLVFHTRDPDEKWNGSLDGGNHFVQSGLYTWRVEMIPQNSAGSEVLQGHVMVLR
jgi:gliding motility-associated-like protein